MIGGAIVLCHYCSDPVDPQDFMIKVQINREVTIFDSHACYRDFFFFKGYF